MRRITIAALTGAAVLFAGIAFAQQNIDFSKVEIKATDLGNKTYMLEGAGGNITVAVGTDGIIMVDAQWAPLHDKIKAAIQKISPLPVKYLINTHYHGDHTEEMPRSIERARPSWGRTISDSASSPAAPMA